MIAERDGKKISVPMRAESEDGKVIGDAWVTLSPGDEGYAEWDEWLKQEEQADREGSQNEDRDT